MITFSYRETWLHKVNPSVKLLSFTALFIAVMLIHNPNTMLNTALGALLPLVIWSGHPGKRLLLYASPFVLIFVSGSLGMMFFGRGQTVWLHIGLLNITEESFYRGLHLGFRALVMAAAGLLFGLTTRPVHLFYSLMQTWRLPPKYAYGFLAGMRMLPIILEEFVILQKALKVRRADCRRQFWSGLGMLRMCFVSLLAQSIRRAHRTAVAMQARRFSPLAARTFYYRPGYSVRDWLFVAYFAALLSF
ncbi:MAG TPA: energy-coupling factor transporter transmembrane component T, partial [Bacilli bacterium]